MIETISFKLNDKSVSLTTDIVRNVETVARLQILPLGGHLLSAVEWRQ